VVEEALPDGVCPDCEGKGWVVVPDGRNGTAIPCDCRKRGRLDLLLGNAGIPLRYQGCTFAKFQTGPRGHALVQAKTLAQQYVANFLTDEGQARESGCCSSAARRRQDAPRRGGARRAHPALRRARALRRFTSLIAQIQSTFDPGSAESKHDVLDPVINAEVLVLDELGAQKPTAWVTDTLYLILNTRYTKRLPTIFTTNFRLDAPATAARTLDRGADSAMVAPELLAARIPPMLLSRLYEMAQPVPIEAEDFRRTVKMAQHRTA
jgi:DNA replication protein DnaC